jgi:stage II sporulation protein D
MGRFRRFCAALPALLLTTLVTGVVPAAAAGPATFTFTGSGWGHGVGMSQYGAYGQALEGRSATQILQHYYTGTTVDPVVDDVALRVNLLHDVPSFTARGESLPGGGGGGIQVVAGSANVAGAAGDVFTFSVSGTTVSVSKGGAVVGSADTVSILWSGGPTLLNVASPTQSLDSAGHRYRYGLVDVAVVGGDLEIVNQLSLHGEYLRGIDEVSASWPAEALKAQVVAARSYAYTKYTSGLRSECRCHVYDSVADQNFVGWSKESETTGAKWVAAVDATQVGNQGLMVRLNGKPVTTFYSSSTGGRSENNEDGFPGGTPLSYLRSVDDHWSLSSDNPFASWTTTRTQAEVAGAFGLPDVVTLEYTQRSAGGAVKTATARSSTGAVSTLSGPTLRSKLALRSAYIRRPVLRVAGADRYATSVAIGQRAAATPTAVVLASGETNHLVDGLVAAPLARARTAPLLLATAGGLPAPVAAEIDRLKPTTAYLVGGTASLGPAVEDQLRARGVTTVTRLSGASRYDTGAAVAREMGSSRPQVVIASGDSGHLVDALAVGGPAAATSRPILLVSRDSVPDGTKQALRDLGVTSTVVVGGAASVSDATMAQLPSPRRLAGTDRYATAVAVSDDFSGAVGVATVAVASGADTNLVDALPGGALGTLTVLTAPTALPASTRGWLAGRPDIGTVAVLGGTAAVSDATFAAIRSAVGG